MELAFFDEVLSIGQLDSLFNLGIGGSLISIKDIVKDRVVEDSWLPGDQ